MPKKYWLFKTEPNTYSIEDLKADRTTCWEGVRNYQARNLLRDDVQVGDSVLVYHSSAKPPGVAGIATVQKAGYPDPYAFDPKSKYFDAKSSEDDPTWYAVDVTFVRAFDEVVGLDQLKQMPELEGMLVTKRGQRLSIQPVEAAHFKVIQKAGRAT